MIIFVAMALIAPHYSKASKNALIQFFKRDRYFVRTPGWLKKLYPGCVWDVEPKEKTLYLSFDDGPHPTITPYILNLLKKYNAQAIFFCIGQNIEKFPEVYRQIIEEGHLTGNHTQHHFNGWKTNDETYIRDITDARDKIGSNFFRPPYGRIKRSQMRLLKEKYPAIKVIMWNILAGDWDENLNPEKCFKQIKARISDGDIIVFHDTDKAFERLEYALPRVLEFFSEKGYRFKKIPE